MQELSGSCEVVQLTCSDGIPPAFLVLVKRRQKCLNISKSASDDFKRILPNSINGF